MTKIKSSKFRLSRRIGKSIHGRSNDSINYRNYFCGQHGQTIVRKASEYSFQLRAKQALKYHHNITEKQLRLYFKKSVQKKGDTGENIIGFLNSRLDITLFRANFATSIYAASQLVSHGHILVNDKPVNIRSYLLEPNDVISIKEKVKDLQCFNDPISKKERIVPEYLTVDYLAKKITFAKVPSLNEVPYAFKAEPHLIIEFYSR